MSAEKFEKPGPSHAWVKWMLKVIGLHVQVYLKDESVIDGTFSCADFRNWSGIVLRNAKVTSTKELVSYTDRKRQTMILKTAEIVRISVKKDISVVEDCAEDISVTEDNKIVKAAPDNFQLSSSSLSIQHELDVRPQQPEEQQQQPQQQEQQQYLDRKLECITFEGIRTLEFQKTADKILSLRFWAGKLCVPYKSEKNVAVREYDKDMGLFFRIMRKISHPYILKARELLSIKNTNGCFIAYEPVEETLELFVTRLEKTKSNLVKVNKVALIARVARQVMTAIIHAHTLKVYHGELTMKNVYICIDSSDNEYVPEPFSVRLSFAEQEKHCVNNSDKEDFIGSKRADFQSVASMLQELANFLLPDDQEEFKHMIKAIDNEKYTLTDLDWEIVTWTLSQKMSFVRFIVKYLPKLYAPPAFADFKWTDHFNDWIEPVKKHCEDNNFTVATYKNLFADYVRFIDDTFSIANEYEPDVQELFGTDEFIMKAFETYTPKLFQWLADYARSLNLRVTFMKSREMFLG